VTIHLKNGETLTRYAEHAKGSAALPLTDDEMKAKFAECANLALTGDASKRALDAIAEIDRMDNVQNLMELLRG
jgi:2-methylcitrate dehydratase PrpD